MYFIVPNYFDGETPMYCGLKEVTSRKALLSNSIKVIKVAK